MTKGRGEKKKAVCGSPDGVARTQVTAFAEILMGTPHPTPHSPTWVAHTGDAVRNEQHSCFFTLLEKRGGKG